MYAYFQKLDYFCTECIYAPFAARGVAREFVKDLEVSSAAARNHSGTAATALNSGCITAGQLAAGRSPGSPAYPGYLHLGYLNHLGTMRPTSLLRSSVLISAAGGTATGHPRPDPFSGTVPCAERGWAAAGERAGCPAATGLLCALRLPIQPGRFPSCHVAWNGTSMMPH